MEEIREIWDAYDKTGNKIQGVTLVRGKKILENGIFHLVSGVIVKHVDGSYLLLQRDFEKSCGGKWDFTAIGSVLHGESALEGAIRELKEETGIDCKELEFVSQVAKEDFHSIFVHYVCVVNCDKTSVTLQEGETVAYKWIYKNTLLSMNDDDFASPNERKLILAWKEEKKIKKN